MKSWPMLLLVAALFAGCQPEPSAPIPQPAATSEAVIGMYRLKVSDEEAAEAGGLSELPMLVIDKDHWRMIAGGEESSGTWVYQDGKLTLTDKSGEQMVFLSDAEGVELVEQSDDPVRFAKYGVTPERKEPR